MVDDSTDSRMSLYKTADGLLETHVTWNDVEVRIQDVLGTSAVFGSNRTVVDIGAMRGFLSKIALIEPDWTREIDGNSEILTKESFSKLPDRLVIKISSELSLYTFSKLLSQSEWNDEKMETMAPMVQECHNREVNMYRILMRERPECPIAKVFAMESFSENNPLKAFIVTEYIPDLYPISMHHNIQIRDLNHVVDAIAAFSAIGERMSEIERSQTIGEVFIEEAIKNFYDEQSPEDMRLNLVQVLGVEYQDTIHEAMDIFDWICASSNVLKNYSRISSFLGHRPVLVHSDIWPSNMLFTKTESNRLEFKALIDFQTASLSSPGLDVACLLVTCLSRKDRRTHRDTILKRYYRSISKSLRSDQSAPYSLDQLRDSYDLCFPAAIILMLPFILSLSMKLKQIPKEAIDKLVGLVEDLIITHNSNLIKFPDFFSK